MSAIENVVACCFDFDLPDTTQLTLQAWQLTLAADLASFSVPSDLPEGFIGIVTSGALTVSNQGDLVDSCCDVAQFGGWIGNIRSNYDIDLGDSASAQMAILGIIHGDAPLFEEPMSHQGVELEFDDAVEARTQVIVRRIEFTAAGEELIPELWVRPAFALTSKEGPRARPDRYRGPISLGLQKKDAASSICEPSPDSAPRNRTFSPPRTTIVNVAGYQGVGFRSPAANPTESPAFALLPDFYVNGDLDLNPDQGRVEGCTWRCKG